MSRDFTMMDHGEQKYREAHQWWLVHDLALYRYRNWMLLWMLRKQMYINLRRQNIGIGRLQRVVDQIMEAHDRMLIEGESVVAAARCASSSEMAGRIYYEEDEGRETNNQNEDP